MKYSKQRVMIYTEIKESDDHLTAEQIYNRLREKQPKLSLGTVYRNLNQLVEAGKLRKVPIDGESDKFDADLKDHSHAICTECKKVFNIDFDPLDEVYKSVKTQIDMDVISCEVIIKGICNSCKQKQKLEKE